MKRSFTKRVNSVLTAVLTIVAFLVGQTAWAQSFPTASGGTGTENDPYLIKTTADLDALASDVNSGNSYSGTYFQLDADIEYDPNDLNANGENYTAIGRTVEKNGNFDVDYVFGGHFDGQNHTVRGIRINKTGYDYADRCQGLFGIVANGGTVKNVCVSDAVITGCVEVGGIAGRNHGTIENCHVSSTVSVIGNNHQYGIIGGIAGLNYSGSSISRCTSAATVSGYYQIGGIVGINYATISDCSANGANVTATDGKGGAIVGDNLCSDGAYTAILSRNYYTGCTLTIGNGNNATTATTNIGCGNKATEDINSDTYTPTDVTEMTVNGVTYYDGAVNYWNWLKNQLAEASTDANNPTVITLVCDAVAGSGDLRLIVETNRHAIIDLNGHKIDRGLTEAKSEGNVIYVRGNASLVIRDSQGGGQITGGYVTNGSGGGITSTGNSRVTLEGGTICGNKSNNHAGGVFVGGTFTMTGGCITDNMCTGNGGSGSAIYTNGGTINISGGTITGNKGPNAIFLTGSGGHLNVSGQYDVSGNTLAGGTTAAPDIMLSGRVITISGALNPTHPATVGFDYGGPTLTSGWSTYMSGAEPSSCFVPRAYDIASGKVIGKLDNELVLGTPEVVYWHADSDHDGTSAEKAYVITTADGLDYLASDVNSGNDYDSDESHPDGYFFQLDNDIAYDPNVLTLDLDGNGTPESNFPGIGDVVRDEEFWIIHTFYGTFDGNGHTISGLYIDKTRCGGDANMYVGLFGNNFGSIKNVTVSNASISGSYHVGGIVGKNSGTIENCHATATVSVTASGSYAGGIAGYNNYGSPTSGSIGGCTSAATVSGQREIGGIAGYNGLNATIEDCLANGASITATNYQGGAIVGENNCYNGVYNAILNRNYYSNCTLTIGNGSPATTNIGCGHKATEDAGTYTPTDITEMTVNSDTYSDGAISALVLADNADNTSIINAHNGETVNVMLYGRTLYKDGGWNTLCLPFNLDIGYDIMNNADNPLHGATIMTFDTRWYNANGTVHAQHNDGNVDGCHRSGQIENGSLYLYFFKDMEGNHGYSSNTAAGEPFLVKWAGDGSNNIVNPVFKGVTISNNTDRMNRTTDEGSDDGAHDGNVTFKSTYGPITFTAENKSVLFLGGNNTLFYPEAGASIGAFRAYFQLGNGLSAGNLPANGVKMFFGNGETDSVGEMKNERLNNEIIDDAWYDLSGRPLTLDPRPSTLKKGIYIHNGKKVIVK